MGKKQTKKLMLKMKKQTGADSKKDRRGKKKEERTGPKFQTLIARQQAAIKKRSRGEKGKEKESQPEKPKKTAYDTQVGAAKGSEKQLKKKQEEAKALKNMSIDEFLTGGFGDLGDVDVSDLSDSEASNNSSDAEDTKNEEVVENSSDEANKEQSESEEEGEEDDDDDDDMDEEKHKEELAKLKEKDPEFYKMLKEEGSELLEFGKESEDELSEVEEAEEEESEEEKEESEEEKEEEDTRTLVTMRYFKDLEKKAFDDQNNAAIKMVVKIFSSIVTEEAKAMNNEEEAEKESHRIEFRVESEKVRERILVSVVSNFVTVLDAKLEIKRSEEPGATPLAKKSQAWSKYERVTKRFLTDLLRAVRNAKDTSARSFLLRKIKLYSTYILSFSGKLPRAYLKLFVSVWGAPTSDEALRIISFSNIQHLAKASKSLLGEILKSCYLEFVRGAKKGSVNEVPRISFQAKCLVELFGVDLSISYQLAFVYIRQLALHLRAAIISKTQESTRSVYSWQFIQCLRLLGSIVAAYPGKPVADEKKSNLTADEQQLRSLAYPLLQVAIGAIKLSPSARFLPLRFHCVAVINQVTRATRYFVPVAPLLLDVLNFPEFHGKKPSNVSMKPPQIEFTLKLSKKALEAAPCQQVLLSRLIQLLSTHLETFRFSIGFPEMIFPVMSALRSFSKKTKVTKWRGDARSVITKCEQWAKEVRDQRLKATFSPANVSRMNQFLSEEEEEVRAQQNISYQQELEKKASGEEVYDLKDEIEAYSRMEEEEEEEEDSEDDSGSEASDNSDEPVPEEAPKTEKRKRAASASKVAQKRTRTSHDADENDVVEDFALSESDSE